MARIVQMDYSSVSKHTQNLSTRQGEKNGLQGSIWQIAVPQDEGKIVKKYNENNLFSRQDVALLEIKQKQAPFLPALTSKTNSDTYNIQLSPLTVLIM